MTDRVSATQNTNNKQQDSLLSGITNSNVTRSLALLLGSALTGSAITTLTGCSESVNPAAVRSAPKEAKFSTIGNDAQIRLSDIEGHYSFRSNLQSGLVGVRNELSSLVAQVESAGSVSKDAVERLQSSIKITEGVIASALKDSKLSGGTTQLNQIATSLTAVGAFNAADFTTGSPAYTTAVTARDQLFDFDTAIGRDISVLTQGMKGAAVAKLNVKLSHAERDLKVIATQADTPDWLTKNQSAVDAAKASAAELKAEVAKARNESFFGPLQDDLGDLDRLLGDVQTVLASPDVYAQYWTRELSKPKSAGQSVVDETEKFIAALQQDTREEVQTTLAAVAPSQVPGASSNGTAAPTGAQPGTTVVYRDSGTSTNDLLLYYMLFNRGGGSYPVYTYPPSNSWSYSGSDRFRTSSQYDTFSRTSNDTASTVNSSSTRGGLSSRTDTGNARPSYSSRSASTGTTFGGTSSPSTSPSSNSGGAFSSKGASTSSGGGWLGGTGRSSSPGTGFGGGSGGTSFGG